MKKIYHKIQFILFATALTFLLLTVSACKKNSTPGIILVGSELCLATLHHDQGIRDVTVYIKYDVPESDFPGYDDLTVYDDSIVSDEFAEACFPLVPPGEHWCIGVGYDTFHEAPIRGSVHYEISRTGLPQDTVILVSEY